MEIQENEEIEVETDPIPDKQPIKQKLMNSNIIFDRNPYSDVEDMNIASIYNSERDWGANKKGVNYKSNFNFAK